MSTDINIQRYLPQQMLPLSKKTDKWREQCVDAVDGMAFSLKRNGRSSKQSKQANYDLMNSRINEENYKYVTDPFKFGGQFGGSPSKLRDYNLVRIRVDRLVGEELERPFDYHVIGVGGHVVNSKVEQQTQELLMATQQKLMAIFKLDPNDPEIEQKMDSILSFKELKKQMNTGRTIRDIREHYASVIVEDAMHSDRLPAKFNKGFSHAAIASEEVYYVGAVNGRTSLRVVNPLNFEFEKGPETEWVHLSDWQREERFMSRGEVIDEFGLYLTEAQLKMLDDGEIVNSMSNNIMYPGFAYDEATMKDLDTYNVNQRYNGNIRVVTCVWKSMKKIGYLSYVDPESGMPMTEDVDDSFKLTEELKAIGATLEWQWLPEYWMGHKIGADIYVDINPCRNQMRKIDSPTEVWSPYIGGLYNNLNSEATSIVDLLAPYQMLYNTIWLRLENEIAKAKGKKMVFDLAQIPKSNGIDMKQWMYYFDNLGIAWINSMEEGRDGDPNSVSRFNQFQSIDLSLANVVQQYIGIMAKIEFLMDQVCGMNPQQLGATSQYETTTGINTALINSSYITEHYFFRHDEIKQAVLTAYIEMSKFTTAGGKRFTYMSKDNTVQSLLVDGEMLMDSDIGVFISNYSKDKRNKMRIEALAEAALQQGKVNLSDLAKLYRSASLIEGIEYIENGEVRLEQSQAQQAQAERESRDQAVQAQLQDKREAREFEAMENQLDRENDILKATIVASGFDEEKDRNMNNIPDVIEWGNKAIEKSRQTSEAQQREKDRTSNEKEKEKDRELKREEMENKMEIEKLKAKTALKNKTNAEAARKK